MAFVAETQRRKGHVHVLLMTTGSVASIKAPLIVQELLKVRSLQLHWFLLTSVDSMIMSWSRS